MKKYHYHDKEYDKVKELAASWVGKDILDIGCGLGQYLELFQEMGCEATGVDINPTQVDKLKDKGFSAFQPNDLPPEKKYDIIFMSHLIEHLPPVGMADLFEHYISFLKPDGCVIVITPMPGERFWHDFTHIRPYTPQSLWMLWGEKIFPASRKLSRTLKLEDIYFFNDPFRFRSGAILGRSYYSSENKNYFLSGINNLLTFLYAATSGKFGRCSSWMGIYKFKE